MFWLSCLRLRRLALGLFLGALLSACSPQALLVRSAADALASQGSAAEEDLTLARDASAFYLKLSEAVLAQQPGHLPLATAVAEGFTQYAYAFVAFEADRLEARDPRGAKVMRDRAAKLYQRAHGHAMRALETDAPGFRTALSHADPSRWPRLRADQVPVAYWAAASWGGAISLGKDDPDKVADLPLAQRLARLAYEQDPAHAQGGLAGLMGSFEAARPGGSARSAERFFDEAIARSQGRMAGPFVAKAESIAQPAGDRAAFEALLKQALEAAARAPGLANAVMQARAQWLLDTADELF